MKLIDLEAIVIPPDRQRKEFKERPLEELGDSIDRVGLLQPIVLREDGRTLVAGERRTRVVGRRKTPYRHDGEAVPVGYIPYVLVTELSEDLLKEAELHENLRRVGLTWQEEARALADLHQLRTTQAAAKATTQTLQATAAEVLGKDAKSTTKDDPELAAQRQKVSDAVLLSKFLDDPMIAVSKDPNEAKKRLRDRLAAEDRQQRLQTFDLSVSPHQLFPTSCYETKLQNLFDVIITDPPYGKDMDQKNTFDGLIHEYDDSKEAFDEVCRKLPELAWNASRPDAHIYVFCDIRRYEELFLAFMVQGWVVWPRPLIWDKGSTGSFGNIEYGFRACYDAILFARKGDRKTLVAAPDVIRINQPTNLPHPAGKPPALMLELLRRSALPGDTVADFFCGHGPIFSAAMDHKVTAYGWEINKKYFDMAAETLAGKAIAAPADLSDMAGNLDLGVLA